MEWTAEADAAIKKVPFFVRKRVRARVEKEAAERGKRTVTLAEVKAARARFLKNMGSEVLGFRVETCFGPNGCPNRAFVADGLADRIEAVMKDQDLLDFLKRHVRGDLKFHHEFRITLADCPNACSQPQIKDVGIIGACLPAVTGEPCTRCEACVETCREDAVAIPEDCDVPEIDMVRCVGCGQCIGACPTGTLATGQKGFRVQLGGKLGRHPRLARELPGVYSEEEVIEIIGDCVAFYKKNSTGGRRFAEIFTDTDFEKLARRYGGR